MRKRIICALVVCLMAAMVPSFAIADSYEAESNAYLHADTVCASVGSTMYTDLQEAVNAALESNIELVLSCDITTFDEINIPEGNVLKVIKGSFTFAPYNVGGGKYIIVDEIPTDIHVTADITTATDRDTETDGIQIYGGDRVVVEVCIDKAYHAAAVSFTVSDKFTVVESTGWTKVSDNKYRKDEIPSPDNYPAGALGQITLEAVAQTEDKVDVDEIITLDERLVAEKPEDGQSALPAENVGEINNTIVTIVSLPITVTCNEDRNVVSVNSNGEDITVIVAAYDNGRMVFVKMGETQGEIELEIDTDKTYDTVKVFCLHDFIPVIEHSVFLK